VATKIELADFIVESLTDLPMVHVLLFLLAALELGAPLSNLS